MSDNKSQIINQKSKIPRILVVDDEPVVIETIRKALKYEGYEILSACNGEAGLRLYFEHQPILVVLDLRMPVMNGLQFLDRIKLKPLDPLSVIVLTGHGSDDEIEQCFRKGVGAFIRKPFNIYEFIGQVRNCIALKEAENALKKSEGQLAATLKSIGNGVITTDLQGKIVMMNDVAEKLTGWNHAQGRSIQEVFRIINKEPCENIENPVNRALEEGAITRLADNRLLISKDGREIPVSGSCSLVKLSDGEIIGAVLVFQDISEKKRREEIFQLEISRAKYLCDLAMEPQLPAMERVCANIRYIPAWHISGDVLEVLELDEKRLLIFLADVTGHGIPAAITASTLKMLFQEISETETEPAVICTHLNRTMGRIILPDDIIAAFCSLIDLESMNITYCLCGVPSPVILRNHEKIRLRPTGMPLGVFENQLIASKTMDLENGDMFMAFTDGISEVRSENGKVFRFKGVEEALEKNASDIHVLTDAIVTEARLFQKKQNFRDDVIILALCFFDGKKIFPKGRGIGSTHLKRTFSG